MSRIVVSRRDVLAGGVALVGTAAVFVPAAHAETTLERIKRTGTVSVGWNRRPMSVPAIPTAIAATMAKAGRSHLGIVMMCGASPEELMVGDDFDGCALVARSIYGA